ncbi:deoxyribose-phosphate aldolase [Lactobacillus sp.] [Lactiplantibacillus mudanjiangensis]|uniref:deoxyribose-phosphate aldolase n=1 Tax=Lactiplantibacillus mudanjiangensis TaxID=1296538 RepID=UPI001014BFEF|nr:deoxyribose-phosphate aldolase [Lactiplantibacillus mudanjiangensis]VDG20160.1 deoxyribose-phosphate aldolase [Lactobacillus sp.] [Lactiplantibacillus mudanjiangensis]VDG33556.1 deoxyribose-phosphate aldolase [Lactobacillus sp.] [Lactiplantibacillus mudanjiangensis]
MPAYTIDDFARMIDHTNLKTDASAADMRKLCDEAKQYHFKMVAINQVQSQICAAQLAGTDIDTGAAISFPLGQTSIASKVFDTEDAIKNGANEIDYVVNQTEVKNGNWDYVQDEMTQLVAACHAHQVPCKVIFENCYLTTAETKQLAEIAKVVRPDFIKTSTGFGTGGATVADVTLMKSVVGDTVKVKAAGGIRNSDDFLAMIKAGADRIGCSAGIKIIDALKARMTVDHVTQIDIDRPYPKVDQ